MNTQIEYDQERELIKEKKMKKYDAKKKLQ